MTKRQGDKDTLLISYLALRKGIGFIGVFLPWAVLAGNLLIFGGGFEPSISAFYYTRMRDVFVGGLCAIGVFLFSYCGRNDADRRAGNLASVFAIGVALFPVKPAIPDPPHEAVVVGWFHYGFAAALFLMLAYFCLRSFPELDPGKEFTPRKHQRNKVYRACGWTILAAIVSMGMLFLIFQFDVPLGEVMDSWKAVFCLETIAISAFGFSWLVKGATLLRDPD